MANHFVYGGIGAILGFLLGGFLVGTICGKEYKKRIESLQYQLDRVKHEEKINKENNIRDREMALSDPDPLKTLKETAIYEGYSEEDEDEDLEVSILKAVEENGEEILCASDDEDELERVYNIMMDELYQDEDEEE